MTVSALTTIRPTPRVLACALLVVGCGVLPFATVDLGGARRLPATLLLLAVFCHGLAAVLVAQRSARTGDRRLLVLAASFLVTGILIAGYVLAVTGTLGADGARTAWIWVAWHAAVPIGLLASVWTRPSGDRPPAAAPTRRQIAAAIAGAWLLGVGLLGVALLLAAVAPGLVGVGRPDGLALTSGLLVVVLGVVALPNVDRRASGPIERWLLLVATASLVDAVLTLSAGDLRTLGGCTAVLVAVLASATLPIALLAEISSLGRALADARAQLRHDAEHDDLTGVLTRRSALARARLLAREDGPQAAVVVLDLDRFKAVNDGHGHPIGDQALAATGQVIRHALRDSDVIGRLGGEEFLIVLPGCDRERAAVIVGRLLAELREIRLADVPALRLTASAGIAELAGDEDRLAAALARADAALYVAKSRGRDRVQVADPAAPPSRARSLGAAATDRGRR